MKSKFSFLAGVASTFALLGAGVASANQFVGDLVYCEVGGTKGVYEPDLGDYGIDGVEVQVHCTNPAGGTCDVTTTTGAYHASVDPATFNSVCSGLSTFDILDPAARNGRYAVNITRPEACPASVLALPLTCVARVNPATLPADCNGLVTPIVTPELPADGNADGDYCDAEDGPFVEGQILGDNGVDPVSCEATASGPPGDGAHEVTITQPISNTRCALFNDFGYEGAEEPCVPCIERKRGHDDRDSDSDRKHGKKHKKSKSHDYRTASWMGGHDHGDSDSDSDTHPSGLPYCPDADDEDSDSDSHKRMSRNTTPDPDVVYCPVTPPPSDEDSDSDSDSSHNGHGCSRDHNKHKSYGHRR